MLKRLHVRNYVLIDSLDIEFPEGLVIITGQTGAGKSIILGALGLALGAKADAAAIGENGGNCVVEAEFSFDTNGGALAALLEENEIDAPDGVLLIRRVVNPTGRSRAFVNDSPVTVQVLSSLASYLIDIHSQHQTMLLSDRHFQMSLLDHFAGDGKLLDDYRTLYRSYNALRSEIERLESSMEKARADYDFNVSRLEKLTAANLRAGELEELEMEQKQLANAEEIKEGLCAAENLLGAVPSGDGTTSVTSILREAARHLDKISSYVPAASSLSERLESARLELEDILSELSDLNSDTDVSDGRLAEVEERLSLLYSLLRSYSCSTEADLIAERDALSAAVSGMAVSDERLDELKRSLDKSDRELAQAAQALSAARHEAAGKLSDAIRDSVRSMELPSAEFRIVLTPSARNQEGADAVQYEFSSTGKNLTDVSKCASGGEMSRIMLALKSIMARYANMPAMIFDEIDTGVSGSVADKMGSVICSMGRFMQVFAITHLPQVAAKGSAHYAVTKTVKDGRTVSEIKRLSDDQRVLEIARMLSGAVLSDAAVANAKALLSDSQSLSNVME